LLVDWTRGDKFIEEVAGKVNMLTPDGNDTALYDACYLGIEKVRRGHYRKQALLLISDGLDSISRYKFKDVRERLRETGVPLYSIGIVPDPDRGFYTEAEAQGKAVMEELSSVSGGVTVYPGNSQKIEAAFEQIAIELRRQYLLGFKPSNGKADGQWHSLKIKVAAPPGAPSSASKLSVRSRSGYYAAKNLR
jgi:Ca-activated chloride channel family protein